MIDLLQDEKIVYEARRHWIVLWTQVLFLISLKILPVFVLAFLTYIKLNFEIKGSTPILILFLYMCWLNIIWIGIFYVWTNYRLTMWVITNQRILMIYQNGFFNREKKEMEYEKIQDITVEEEGLMAHIFKFGNIRITSASETGGFLMDTISHPDKARQAISSFVHKQNEHVVVINHDQIEHEVHEVKDNSQIQ